LVVATKSGDADSETGVFNLFIFVAAPPQTNQKLDRSQKTLGVADTWDEFNVV
jgi:hypothetical protein